VMRVMAVNMGVRPSLRRTCLSWLLKNATGLFPCALVCSSGAHS
jgi:hypothetical protein